MCTYNGAEFLKEQLDSLINQTYPIYELIIQDDGSTDSTVSILEEYVRRYDFIHLYQNESQKGINKNFYSAISRAKGEYIAISDQDDIWEPDKIEFQVNTIGDKWLSCGMSKHFLPDKPVYFNNCIPNGSIERLIYVNTLAPGHTMLLKKEMVPFIPQKSTIMYDHIILIVAVSHNMISFLNKVLVNYRVHDKSATYHIPAMKAGGNNKNIVNIIKSTFRTFKQYILLRNKIHCYFAELYSILKEMTCGNKIDAALKIAEYQSKKGFISYMKLTYYCIKSRTVLFYSIEKDGVLTFFRALFFPISCSDYFRYMLNKKTNNSNK